MSQFTLLHQLRIQRVVRFSGKHFLAFGCHFRSSESFVAPVDLMLASVALKLFLAEGNGGRPALRRYSAES
jgi:hypothetical protein